MNKARELLDDGWSLVVFPEGARSPDGHAQRFRHGTSRLCIEAGVGAVPIAIRGAYQAMPKGPILAAAGPTAGQLRYGAPLYPNEGETHQDALAPDEPCRGASSSTRTRRPGGSRCGAPSAGRPRRSSGPQGPEWLTQMGGLAAASRARPPDRTWE